MRKVKGTGDALQERERYYPGDDAWERFVRLEAEDCELSPDSELVKRCGGDLDLACTIASLHQSSERALMWMQLRVPALDGLTPQECLKTPRLQQRLRTALMRFPS